MFSDPESLRVWYSIVYGGWALTLAGYAYYRIADMQNAALRRQLTAALNRGGGGGVLGGTRLRLTAGHGPLL